MVGERVSFLLDVLAGYLIDFLVAEGNASWHWSRQSFGSDYFFFFTCFQGPFIDLAEVVVGGIEGVELSVGSDLQWFVVPRQVFGISF